MIWTITSAALVAANFSTPQGAIRSLENAYVKKDIEAAVAAKDFIAEAQLMLQHADPKLLKDRGIVSQTANVLELSFRKQIKDQGFPNFSGVKCSLGSPKNISATLVNIVETCVFPDGGTSVQTLHVFNGAHGWRVIFLPGDT